MRIHIFGAAASGTTSLGRALADALACPFFDADDYIWHDNDPPYQHLRDKSERNALLSGDTAHNPDCVVSGSVIAWDGFPLTLFDFGIYLWLPTELRIKRLIAREEQRFGRIIYDDAARHKKLNDFIAWASAYETRTDGGRSRQSHEGWIAQATIPVLELRRDKTVRENLEKVLEKLGV